MFQPGQFKWFAIEPIRGRVCVRLWKLLNWGLVILNQIQWKWSVPACGVCMRCLCNCMRLSVRSIVYAAAACMCMRASCVCVGVYVYLCLQRSWKLCAPQLMKMIFLLRGVGSVCCFGNHSWTDIQFQRVVVTERETAKDFFCPVSSLLVVRNNNKTDNNNNNRHINSETSTALWFHRVCVCFFLTFSVILCDF